jgi:hemin uptake protein HemP
MSDQDHRKEAPQNEENAAPVPRILQATEVFKGEREILIEHAGTCYRLRITRRNRLILQK